MEDNTNHLVSQVKALTEQVAILKESVEAIIDRNNQFLLIYQDQAQKMSQLMTHTMVLNEALTKSLSESDQQIDDLAKIVAAVLTVQKQLEELRDEQES